MEIVQDLKTPDQVVWDFYGTPLKAMRRTQLWRLCDIHQIEYPKGGIKDILLSILENRETMLQAQGGTLLSPPSGMTEDVFWKLINGPRKEYNEYTGGLAAGQTNIEEMQRALEPKPHFEMQTPSDMSWPDLKKFAAEEGIKVLPNMNREQIEGLLRGDTS